MGCDIHMYVEYRKKESGRSFNNFGGRINPGRNYYIFGLLAKGVRTVIIGDGFPPKGMPDFESLGDVTKYESIIYINDKYAEKGVENYTSIKQAKQWEWHGHKILKREDGTPYAVEHPDWHSHSYMTLTEFEQQIQKYHVSPQAHLHQEPEYNAVLAGMKSLDNDGFETRIVFWFEG